MNGAAAAPSTASKSAAAGGASTSNLFKNMFTSLSSNGNTQDDRSARFREMVGVLLSLHEQIGSLHSRMGDTIRFSAAKGGVATEGREKLLESAITGIADTLRPLQKESKHLDEVALLDGHLKTCAYIGRANKDGQESSNTGFGVSFLDALSILTRNPHQEQVDVVEFVRSVNMLSADILRETLLPFASQQDTQLVDQQTHHTTMAKMNTSLYSTAPAVGRAVAATLVPEIRGLLARRGLSDVLAFGPVSQSAGVLQPFRLVRLAYVFGAGGDWTGSGGLIRLAKHHKRVESLPIELTADDVDMVGRKALFDRPSAIRQWSLFGHRLGRGLELPRSGDWGVTGTVGGRGILSGLASTRGTQSSSIDRDGPPISLGRARYSKFSDVMLRKLTFEGARPVYCKAWCELDERCDVMFDLLMEGPGRGVTFDLLMDEPAPLFRREKFFLGGQEIRGDAVTPEMIEQYDPPTQAAIKMLKDGCRTADHTIGGTSSRLVVLCGEEAGDPCAVHMALSRRGDGTGLVDLEINTTEEPQDGGNGPRFPVAVSKMAAITRYRR
mmetsp:Transcript_23057/g.65999  ORF Transcript_23057/g.65999 Transcript_23057/m.65999 type:complete len:554 (+) Transcript_23057:143-1804(+)